MGFVRGQRSGRIFQEEGKENSLNEILAEEANGERHTDRNEFEKLNISMKLH